MFYSLLLIVLPTKRAEYKEQVLNHTNFDICVFRVSYYPTSLWLRVPAGPYPEIIHYIIVFDWSEAVQVVYGCL